MEKKRCPNCGALNTADAQWCNQCLTTFAPPPPPPVEEPALTEAEPATTGDRGPALDASAGLPDPLIDASAPTTAVGTAEPAEGGPLGTPDEFTPPEEVVGTRRGAFEVKREGITWTCSVCDAENPLAASACQVCGTSFAEALRPKKPRISEGKDPGTATLLSLFLPGAGHWYLGLKAQAVARGILNVWVIVIVLLAGIQGGAGSALIPLMFGLIAFGLWIVNAHDAYREANDEPTAVLLKGRMFMWLVLGILGLLMLLVFTAAMQARG